MCSSTKLLIFDMDSTLIDMEIINELAKVAGVGEKVEDITTKAMQGKIDFERALKDRVRLLRGLPEREVKRVAETAPLIRGAKRLIKEAKSRGYKTALVTGSFMTVAKIIGEKLNLDYVIANELGVKDGRLIGDVKGPLLTLDSKEQVLVQIAALEGVPLKNCVVVGDGANDMGMFKRAGLSIAFNANSVLKDVADITITQKNLELIIPLLP